MHIDNLLSLVKERTSCRSYRDEKILPEMIDKCLEAARLAPSACNKQPWRFVLVENAEKRAALCSEGIAPGLLMPWMKGAPLLIALCADTSLFPHVIGSFVSGIKYHYLDLGIAGEHFILAAQAQGLGTCWIGWIKPKKIRKILDLPKPWEVVSLISVGFPADESVFREKLDVDQISRRI